MILFFSQTISLGDIKSWAFDNMHMKVDFRLNIETKNREKLQFGLYDS